MSDEDVRNCTWSDIFYASSEKKCVIAYRPCECRNNLKSSSSVHFIFVKQRENYSMLKNIALKE